MDLLVLHLAQYQQMPSVPAWARVLSDIGMLHLYWIIVLLWWHYITDDILLIHLWQFYAQYRLL